MAIPYLSSGITPPVDWVSRRLFGSTKYLDKCIVPGWEEAYNLGISVCRKIAGSSSWSQHAHANGLDIGIPGYNNSLGDEIAEFLRGPEVSAMLSSHGCSIAHLLWKVDSHHDHIHLDFNPYGKGTPPCAGGPKGPTVPAWPLDTTEEELTKQEHDALLQVRNAIQGVGLSLGRKVEDKGFYTNTGKDIGLAVKKLLESP